MATLALLTGLAVVLRELCALDARPVRPLTSPSWFDVAARTPGSRAERRQLARAVRRG